MQAERKLSLSLLAVSTSVKKPIFKVRVNGQYILPVLSDGNVKEELFTFEHRENSIDNIEITLINKAPDDTKLENGVITEDLLLIVKQLKIDHIDLTNKMNKISNYVGVDGTAYHTHGYITFNGTMKFKIHKNLLYTDWLSSFL